MRAHIIENGIVVNTIEVESLDFMPGLVEATEGAIGWSYDGHAFTPPPPIPAPVPEQITMRQCRLQLLAGGLLDDVDAAINSLPSPQKEAARIEWEYAAEVQRNSGLVRGLGGALGLDAAGLDALFVEASKL